jgi:hypothetical protein
MTTKTDWEFPIPHIPSSIIMRNRYYDLANLRKTIAWSEARIAQGVTNWEKNYLVSEIARIECAIRKAKES